MAGWHVSNIFAAVGRHLGQGEPVNWAVSYGLREVFAQYTYSFAVSGLLLIVGLQLLIFALLFMQNEFYYHELYKIVTQFLSRDRRWKSTAGPPTCSWVT